MKRCNPSQFGNLDACVLNSLSGMYGKCWRSEEMILAFDDYKMTRGRGDQSTDGGGGEGVYEGEEVVRGEERGRGR